MRVTKVIIKNLYGIAETELDGQSIELSGSNGTGKTSIIDAIRYGLTNSSERDLVVKNGENEGEIIIETDTGLRIARKKRTDKADYKSIKENGKDVWSPETFLSTIFTPLQLNPVEFCEKSKDEQNRIILDLINFDWDMNWIKEQFGEIPQGVDYSQNILKVLHDIQSEKGIYFQRRQDINREIRNNRAFISDIAKDIPDGYNADMWENFDISSAYDKLGKAKEFNSRISRAQAFIDAYNGKVRGFEAEKEIAITTARDQLSKEKENLLNAIEKKKGEIALCEQRISGLDNTLTDKIALAESEYREKIAKLDSDITTANDYAHKDKIDTAPLQAEIDEANAMKRHINEYRRMVSLQADVDEKTAQSEALTAKIELARKLPGEILETATLPVEGLTVVNGIPYINGLPVSNLSEGEKLDLCVDVAISNPASLQIILIDGVERLSDTNRDKLYRKCKEKGLQFIATRTTNNNELEVVYFE